MQGTYRAQLRTRKTTAQGNLLPSAASQGIFENNENLVGIVHFEGLDLTNKAITAITLELDAARAGYGIESTKTVFVRKSNYQAASQSGVTGLQYVGAALGSFTGHFYGNRQNVSITGALLTALGEYLAQGNNTICLYDANAVQGGQGYSANYLEFDEVSASITYAEGLSTPSVSPTGIIIGESVTISISRLISAATHRLRYKLGTASGTIADDVAASKTWTPPAALAEQIAETGSGTVTIYCDTKVDGSVIGTKTCELRITAAASVPTVSPSTVTLGEDMTITTNRTSSAAKHKITYTIGAKTGTIATEAGAHATWTPGYDLAQYFGTGSTASCVITCVTYIGGVQIGTPKTVNVTLKAPVSKPTVSAANVTLGTQITIYTNRTIDTAVHRLTYEVGDSSGTIATNVGASRNWTPPVSLAEELKAKGTKKCTITCETIINGVSVGSKTVTVTLAVPASTITADAECFLDAEMAITISRSVSTAVHTLRYVTGSAEGVIAENAETGSAWVPPRSLGAKFGNSATKSCVIYCDTYVGGVLIGSSSASVTLKIPASRPTFSANPVELGSSVTITTNRYSRSVKHDIVITKEPLRIEQIFEDAGASVVWTPSLTDYAPYITNGSDSRSFSLLIRSRIGDTTIGQVSTQITLKVPAGIVPTIAISDIQQQDSAIQLQFGGFVQSKSRIRPILQIGMAYSAQVTATYTVDGKTYAQGTFSDTLKNAQTRTLRASGVDTRGRTATASTSFLVITYKRPTITTFKAERCSDDGSTKQLDGTKVRFTAVGSIARANNNGVAKNTKTMTIYVRVKGSGTWTQVVTYTGNNLGWDFEKQNVLLPGTFNAMTAFDIKCEVTDWFETVAVTVDVPTKTVMISLPQRGNGIAFGKISERANRAEFGWRLWLQYALDIANGGTGGTTKLEAQTNLLTNISETESGITEATDLDTLKTVGNYYVYGNVSTNQHYPRTASDMRCMIYVSGVQDSHVIQTIAYISTNVEIYTRMYQNATGGGTWTEWIRISGATPFVNATLAANVSNSPGNRGNGPLRYRREGAHVYITGGVLTTWDGSSQRQLTTLPAGFRPNAGPIYRVVRANPESAPTTNRVASLRITTAGLMYLDWIYNFSGAAYTNEAWVDCNMDFWTE